MKLSGLSKKLRQPLFLLVLIISSSVTPEAIAKWGAGGAFVGGLALGGLTAAALSNNSDNTTVVYSNGYYDPYGYYDYDYGSPYWEPYPAPIYDGYYGGYYGYGPYWNNYAYGWRRSRGYRHRHHMRRHHVHHHHHRSRN
ncbi:MAG TPA: hypothetical protein VJJ81_00095 [Candidatus Babeliales bacterium]|nr:hypothetical protein [Candidatus Babeliales bacterium]